MSINIMFRDVRLLASDVRPGIMTCGVNRILRSSSDLINVKTVRFCGDIQYLQVAHLPETKTILHSFEDKNGLVFAGVHAMKIRL